MWFFVIAMKNIMRAIMKERKKDTPTNQFKKGAYYPMEALNMEALNKNLSSSLESSVKHRG